MLEQKSSHLAALALSMALSTQPACFGLRMEATARAIEEKHDMACRVRSNKIFCSDANQSLTCDILDKGERALCEFDINSAEVAAGVRDKLRQQGHNCVGGPIKFYAKEGGDELISC